MPSIHSSLQIVPQLLDRIEIRTPCRPFNEINSMIVEPLSTCGSFVLRCVVLLKPPLSTGPELMSRSPQPSLSCQSQFPPIPIATSHVSILLVCELRALDERLHSAGTIELKLVKVAGFLASTVILTQPV